jgi:N-acetylmuramoyl-L-alanine amidase
MEVKDHKLVGEKISFDPTTKISGEFGQGAPDTIIIHYTAGNDAKAAVKVLKNPTVKASAHMVVSREGEIVQLANLNVITWHAGVSGYNFPNEKRTTFNKYSIGIEIANDGYLKLEGGKFYNYFKREIAAEFAFKGRHRNYPTTRSEYWHSYTEEQVKVVFEICAALIKAYPSIKYILGHEEIAPGRKTDPGPAFPLDELRQKMGVWIPGTAAPVVAEPEKEKMPLGTIGVATGKVNFRSGPGADYEKVAEALEKDEKVLVLKKSGDWYEVMQDITGWVSKEYILQDNTDDEADGSVNAEILNIRDKPNGEKIAKPLTKGQKVNIIKQDEGWMQVETQVKGWVAAQYIKLA